MLHLAKQQSDGSKLMTSLCVPSGLVELAGFAYVLLPNEPRIAQPTLAAQVPAI